MDLPAVPALSPGSSCLVGEKAALSLCRGADKLRGRSSDPALRQKQSREGQGPACLVRDGWGTRADASRWSGHVWGSALGPATG